MDLGKMHQSSNMGFSGPYKTTCASFNGYETSFVDLSQLEPQKLVSMFGPRP